jgi:UDP-N-acetylmuramoyl-tripeptide--D-alanyl-D-alanine ligase
MDIKELYSIFTAYPLVCTDSRRILPDSIFFALKGDRFDGNRYVKQALAEGCAYAVSDDPANAALDGCIMADNVEATLGELARMYRDEMNVPLLAVTGTNGKTTTKELAGAVLSSMFRTHCTAGNLNNHIGVPLTLLSMPRDAEIAVVELGASHPGEIAALCRIARPNFGLVTNVGRAHLEGFGSEDGVRKTKGELFDFLAGSGGAIFYNADDAVVADMARAAKGAALYAYGAGVYGATPGDGFALEFSLRAPAMRVVTRLAGGSNLNNALAAVAVGLHFGVPAADIASALERYTPNNNRSQIIETAANILVADAYNANPSSTEAALRAFAALDKPNKTVILGDMLELGDKALDEHRRILQLAVALGFDDIILTGSLFYRLREGSPARHFADTTEARLHLAMNPPSSRTILLKGSRGMGLENLIEIL